EVFLRRRLDDDARGLDEVVEREERGGRAQALEEALGLLAVARGRADEPEARKALVEGEADLPTDGAEAGDAHVHDARMVSCDRARPDREIVALLSACLAYGRVDLFGRALQGVLASMGSSPAAFVTEFEPRRDGAAFKDFWYRFNRPHDLVAFCIAARDLLARFGTLEKCFAAGDEARSVSIGPALERFARAFLEADLREVFQGGRISRGYRHLFPLPSVGGPCKRLHLFLRWMVRREPPDFGLWTSVSPSRLLMPKS